MSKSLDQLYREHILRHSKHPFHEDVMAEATHELMAYNSFCGDKYKLFLKEDEGIVTDASFTGFGCAISKASTSILVKNLIGKKRDEIAGVVNQFLEMVDPDINFNRESPDIDDEIKAFSAARDFPERVKCATLSWEEIRAWLNPGLKKVN